MSSLREKKASNEKGGLVLVLNPLISTGSSNQVGIRREANVGNNNFLKFYLPVLLNQTPESCSHIPELQLQSSQIFLSFETSQIIKNL